MELSKRRNRNIEPAQAEARLAAFYEVFFSDTPVPAGVREHMACELREIQTQLDKYRINTSDGPSDAVEQERLDYLQAKINEFLGTLCPEL